MSGPTGDLTPSDQGQPPVDPGDGGVHGGPGALLDPHDAVSRRTLFTISGAAALAGTTMGITAGGLAAQMTRTRRSPDTAPDTAPVPRLAPTDMTVTSGDLPHGLADPVPAFGTLLAFDVTPAARRTSHTTRAAASAFLRGTGPIPTQPSGGVGVSGLDLSPTNLQVTPGIGASLLDAVGLAGRRPEAFVDLPRFAVDRLDPRVCDGDLLVQVGAEDPMRLAGAVQQVLSLAGDGVRLRWSRSGFKATAAASQHPTGTPRNLMGHRDGSANPPLGTVRWDYTVRVPTPGWMRDGSYLVVRQIRIDLTRWFAEPADVRDRAIGRDTTSGAPLGGHGEFETGDLSARDASGQPVIPRSAHLRLANQVNTRAARIYRRSWNYDDGFDGFDASGRRQAGLVFVAWQSDICRGSTPIQQSLDAGHDGLSDYLTHFGSAVFAIPARGDDDYPGQSLLES